MKGNRWGRCYRTATRQYLGRQHHVAQTRHLKVPGGLAFLESGIRGLAGCLRQSGRPLFAAILANPVMIELPGRRSRERQAVPDGSKMAKIHWNPKKLERPRRDGAGYPA